MEEKGMERHMLVEQLRFPPGYRFVPTDEQLVDVYLRRKIEDEDEPMPLHVVNEVSILDWTPANLVEKFKGYGENKWYFFTKRDKSSSNKENEPSRKVKAPGVTASWKATGSVVPIMRTKKKKAASVFVEDGGENKQAAVDEEEPVLVGFKRVLTYQSTDPVQNGKWSMHEYILQGHEQMGKYSLCSIQRMQHSYRSKNKNGDAGNKDQEKSCTEEPSSSSEAEGVQLQQHPETETALAEQPRLTPTAEEINAQDQTTSKGKEVVVPALQLQQAEQYHHDLSAPAPLPVMNAVPLQALLSYYHPGGGMAARASTPAMHEEQGDDAGGGSFQCDDIFLSQLQALQQLNSNYPMMFQHNNMSQFLVSEYSNPTMVFNNSQEEQPSSCFLTDVMDASSCPDTSASLAQSQMQQGQGYGLYGAQNQNQPSFSGENDEQSPFMTEWQYADQTFLGNTTQLMDTGGWEHGVQYQDDQQINYQCYDDQHFKGSSSLQVDLFAHAGTSPDEQFIEGSEAAYDSEAFAESVLLRQQDDPEDSGSDDWMTSSSQSQDEQLRCSSGGLLEDVVQGHMGWHETGI